METFNSLRIIYPFLTSYRKKRVVTKTELEFGLASFVLQLEGWTGSKPPPLVTAGWINAHRSLPCLTDTFMSCLCTGKLDGVMGEGVEVCVCVCGGGLSHSFITHDYLIDKSRKQDSLLIHRVSLNSQRRRRECQSRKGEMVPALEGE